MGVGREGGEGGGERVVFYGRCGCCVGVNELGGVKERVGVF